MVISFLNKKIREVCENIESANEYLEPNVIQILNNRLSDFESANNLSEIPTGNIEELREEKNSYFTIELIKNYKLIFVNNCINLDESNYLEWVKITRIKITDIHNENRISIFT